MLLVLISLQRLYCCFCANMNTFFLDFFVKCIFRKSHIFKSKYSIWPDK